MMAVETGQGKPPNLYGPGWVGSWSESHDRTLGLQDRNWTNPKARAVLSRMAAGRSHKYEEAPQGPEPKNQSGQAWKSTDIGSAAADFSTSKFLHAKPGLTHISKHKP